MYFIYDEQNYLKEKIDSTKMIALYEKQKKIYDQYGIPNYIILVDYINEYDDDEEDISDCAENLIKYITERFEKVQMWKTILTLFSMKNGIIFIAP